MKRTARFAPIAILYGLAGIAMLVGCGGGGGTKPPLSASTAAAGKSPTPGASGTASASASATPTPAPTPTPIPLSASPAAVAFGGINGTQLLTVTDKGYVGTITAVSNDQTIVAVAPASITVGNNTFPASTGTFTLTSIGIGTNQTGSTTITISDGTLTINVPVTVSQTSGTISFRPLRLRLFE